MRIALLLVVGLSACSRAFAANECLDPTNSGYRCESIADGELDLGSCGITDEDVQGGDLASCLNAVGRDIVLEVSLTDNHFTTLPEGVFQNLTALEELYLHNVGLTTLPEFLFQGLTALQTLYVYNTTLTALPEGIFQGLGSLEALSMGSNNVTVLPEGIFQGTSALRILYLDNMPLTTLPEDIFQNVTTLEVLGVTTSKLVALEEGTFFGLTALEELDLGYNALTTLPAGIFQDLTALQSLWMEGNSLECLPANNATSVSIDSYGDECGCTITDDTDNVCGEEACTPGPVGYTCEPATDASTASADDSSSSNLPIIAGSVSTVAGAALIALGVIFARRCTAKKDNTHTVLPPDVMDDVEEGNPGHAKQPGVHYVTSSAAVAGTNGFGRRRWHEQQDRLPPSGGDPHERDVPPPSYNDIVRAPTTDVQSGAGRITGVVKSGSGSVSRVQHNANHEQAGPTLTASISSRDVSTEGPAELARDTQGQSNRNGGAPRTNDVRKRSKSRKRNASSKPAGQPRPSSDVGIGQAALEVAQELASQCQVPGVSEAAALVAILVSLVTDSQDCSSGADARLRQCRSIVLMLERAADVAETGGDTAEEGTRVLIEDVYDAISDVVQLVKTYQSKNRLSKLLMSTLFKRRQEELDAVVDRAIARLQLGLQVQVGKDVSAVKREMNTNNTSSIDKPKSDLVAEARRARRQRKLDQVEIPEDHVTITDEMLGKGGFGEVYLADYNGRNAAAKVLHITDEPRGRSDCDHSDRQLEAGRSDARQEDTQHRSFLRELDAMIRLRSPHTVNVYGAVTSNPNRMILVMELLAGGDLRTMLRNAREPLANEVSRQLIGDICVGMAFLHGKNTVHGDLKSANVLLDGAGRAKIGDFGTSRWAHHTNSTGLATYTKAGQSTQMSLAWSAPEVLDARECTYASDVYSFGVVAWEVLSREVPWARVPHPKDVYIRVVLKGLRPEIPVGAPRDLADVVERCWAGDPQARPHFSDVMETIATQGWTEQ